MTEVNQKKKRWPRWAWPGLLAAGAGGAAMFLLRGCWHSKMGWPMRERALVSGVPGMRDQAPV